MEENIVKNKPDGTILKSSFQKDKKFSNQNLTRRKRFILKSDTLLIFSNKSDALYFFSLQNQLLKKILCLNHHF